MGRGSLGLAASASWRPIEGFFQGPSSRGWSAAAGGGECGRGGSAMPFGRRRRIGVIGAGKNSRMGRWPAVNCGGGSRGTAGAGKESWVLSDDATPYQILGVDPSCSPSELKTAFRSRVKEFHPDVCKDIRYSDTMIRRVIQAYEMLSKYHKFEDIEGESSDPFENPECEAVDVFVNEILCVGKACPYSCVKTAPHAFSFSPLSGAARAISQDRSENYQVQLAVGQCPRRCIHYVTPSQRSILEELLCGILNSPYDEAEVAVLDALIARASFQNNRYQKPKKEPKSSTEFVDWF